ELRRQHTRLALGDAVKEHLRFLPHETFDDHLAYTGAAPGNYHRLAGERKINSVRHIVCLTSSPGVAGFDLCVELDRGETLLARAVTRLARAAEGSVVIDAGGGKIGDH